MPNTTTQRKYKRQQRQDMLDHLSDAIEEYKAAKEAGEQVGLREVAARHGVSKSTLGRVVHPGTRTITEFNKSKRLLNSGEDHVLVEYVQGMANRGFPLTKSQIGRHATAIVQAREGSNVPAVGRSWSDHWVEQHSNNLAVYWGSRLDSKRGYAVNPTSNAGYWSAAYNLIVKHNVQPNCLLAADEIGIQFGYESKHRVVGGKGKKIQHVIGDGNKEMVTVLETICASGEALQPLVIYKGTYFMESWFLQENPLNASSVASCLLNNDCAHVKQISSISKWMD